MCARSPSRWRAGARGVGAIRWWRAVHWHGGRGDRGRDLRRRRPWGEVTAGFEFDVPVRFDTDRIQVSVASFQAGEVPAVPVVEVRL
jgi:hypothetical protein